MRSADRAGGPGITFMRAGHTASVSREIAAEADRLYRMIADVTRMGEWSPECRSARWLEPEATARIGARFRGHNRWGPTRWSRTCEVTVAEPGRSFAFRTLSTRVVPDSTGWRYDLEPVPGGTRVTESYEIVEPMPMWIQRVLVTRMLPHHFDMRPHMSLTLDRLAASAESAG